jgi:hypothetical protein
MKMKRDSSLFMVEHEMRGYCRALEASGFREADLGTKPLHRSYTVQSWVDGADVRRWRVDAHEHGKSGS